MENGSKVIDDEGKVAKAEKPESEKSENDETETVTIETGMSQPSMIEALEIIMQSAYDAGYLKAADLLQQAMASIGKGEK